MKKAKLSPAELNNLHLKLQNGEGISSAFYFVLQINKFIVRENEGTGI